MWKFFTSAFLRLGASHRKFFRVILKTVYDPLLKNPHVLQFLNKEVTTFLANYLPIEKVAEIMPNDVAVFEEP